MCVAVLWWCCVACVAVVLCDMYCGVAVVLCRVCWKATRVIIIPARFHILLQRTLVVIYIGWKLWYIWHYCKSLKL